MPSYNNPIFKLLESINSPASKLTPSLRNSVAKGFKEKGLDGNGRFESVSKGIVAIHDVLSKNGIQIEDIMNSHLFLDDKGTRNFEIGFINKADPFTPLPISNSVLVFSWYKRENYNYEIHSYLSS